MGCLSPEILLAYPNLVICGGISTADPTDGEITPLWVADTPVGFVQELERTGQTANAPGTGQIAESPYSTRLRHVFKLGDLYSLGDVPCVVESVTFLAYDATLTGAAETEPVSGNTYQDATTTSDMVSSQTSAMDANAGSRFRNALTPNWQPNWFRPRVLINGQNILPNLSQSHLTGTDGHHNHQGDLGIGLPLPFSLDLVKRFDTGIQSIEIDAQVVQYVPNTTGRKYVRYPVYCVLIIRHK